jgi:hypothetical protein
MKKCYRCGIIKEDVEFSKDKYKTDGYKSCCKVCCKIRWPSNHELEAIRVAKWNKKNNYKTQTKYRLEHLEKYHAKILVKQARCRGELIKPNQCENCLVVMDINKIQAHHKDYSKPLEVQWLCRKCHDLERVRIV